MMDFELKLEKPNVSHACILAATIGAAYFVGKLLVLQLSVTSLIFLR